MEIIDFRIRHNLLRRLANINVFGIRYLSKILPTLIIPKPRDGIIIKTMHGFNLKIDPLKDTGVERSIYYTGTYELACLHIIKNILQEGEVFVDIGANIGLMSVFSALIVQNKGVVYSFEPNPATRSILKENIHLNDVKNIIVSEYAIGSKTDKGRIFENWHINRGGASLIDSGMGSDYYDITIIKLDEFVNLRKPIKLIKIDVEGYEMEALKGSMNIISDPKGPILIVECVKERAFQDYSGDDLFSFITKVNNYRIFKSIGRKKDSPSLVEVTDAKDLPQHANIYCFLPHHYQAVNIKQIFKRRLL